MGEHSLEATPAGVAPWRLENERLETERMETGVASVMGSPGDLHSPAYAATTMLQHEWAHGQGR